MDNENGQGSGNFMNGQGGSALARAMQRHGMSGGVTNQTTQGGILPGSPPQGSPPQPGAMAHPSTFVPPQAQAAMQQPPAPQPQPQPGAGQPMPGQPLSDPQAPLQTVLDAMADFVESQSKIQEVQAGVMK